MKLTQCKIATVDEFREGEGEDMSRLVVITFSKADAERLRLIKRELRLTSDYYKSD